MIYADVIIPLGVEGFFTYSVPEEWEHAVAKGGLVAVSFAGKKRYTGVVYALHSRKPEGVTVKPIDQVLDAGFTLSEKHLKFLLWMSEYYMAPPGDVIRAAFPVAMRLESYTCVGLAEPDIEDQVFSDAEKKVLNLLRPGEFLSITEIEKCLRGCQVVSIVKSLLDQGVVAIKEKVDDLFKPKQEKRVCWVRRFEEEELSRLLDTLKRAPVQYRMLCKWIEYCEEQGVDFVNRIDFSRLIGDSAAALKALCDRGILKIDSVVVRCFHDDERDEGEVNELSDTQQLALKQIRDSFQKKDCVLLQGVTSSGKTEVYIHLIREVLAQNKQVLYLLPEIALTVQIVRRLQKAFGNQVGIYHSGMSDRARMEMWKKQNGDIPYRLVLGVRSSVFLPFRELGLVIVDEEHEGSYKQKEPSPRYNGRDAAIMLGKMFGAKIVLGSATPSFESYGNAMSGKYDLIRMDVRYGDVKMPELVFADMKEFRRKKLMKGAFTPVLFEEVRRALEKGMQVILLQNRRGYSTYLQCDHCGAIPRCKHCDVSMTYYKYRNTLNCHYCGSLRPVPALCEECGQGHYIQRTPGTERIEEEVSELFPEARVARMDLEVMNSKTKYKTLIDRFEAGDFDILIGTQMVSKGLDFERVKLVGVMDADSLIGYPDFRSEERTYAMLTQVSGRSGRKGERGKVVIQLSDSDNRVYRWVAQGSYPLFYEALSREREFFGYPPFGRLIQLELRHKDEIVLRRAANELAEQLRSRLDRRVCGPAVPEVSRIREMRRIQLLIKAEPALSLSKLKSFLKGAISDLLSRSDYRTLKVYFDVDPM